MIKNMSKYAKRISGRFLILFAALFIGGNIACSSSRSDSANSAVNSNTAAPVSSASGAGGGNTKNQEQITVDAEKEKLQKDREKLEKEKQDLKDEKAKTEKMRDAIPPDSGVTNTVMTVAPPTNIRDSPNGKIICVVKKQATVVRLYGSTDISDNNGEWFYTKHCGKMGVIHSSQFVSPN